MRKTSLAKIGQIILAKSPDKYYQLMYDLAWAQSQKQKKRVLACHPKTRS